MLKENFFLVLCISVLRLCFAFKNLVCLEVHFFGVELLMGFVCFVLILSVQFIIQY